MCGLISDRPVHRSDFTDVATGAVAQLHPTTVSTPVDVVLVSADVLVVELVLLLVADDEAPLVDADSSLGESLPHPTASAARRTLIGTEYMRVTSLSRSRVSRGGRRGKAIGRAEMHLPEGKQLPRKACMR
jgi:hypothetical protein